MWAIRIPKKWVNNHDWSHKALHIKIKYSVMQKFHTLVLIILKLNPIQVFNTFSLLITCTLMCILGRLVGLVYFLHYVGQLQDFSLRLKVQDFLIRIIIIIERLCRTNIVLYVGQNLHFIIYTGIYSEKKFTYKKHSLSFAMVKNYNPP